MRLELWVLIALVGGVLLDLYPFLYYSVNLRILFLENLK